MGGGMGAFLVALPVASQGTYLVFVKDMPRDAS